MGIPLRGDSFVPGLPTHIPSTPPWTPGYDSFHFAPPTPPIYLGPFGSVFGWVGGRFSFPPISDLFIDPGLYIYEIQKAIGFHPALPPTQLNATLDLSSTDGSGHWKVGSGIPSNGVIKQNVGSFENAEMFTYRTGNTIQAGSVNADGSFNFYGPAGSQVVDLAHGVSAANANRGAIAIGFSFDTDTIGPGGMTQQQLLAAGGKELVRIDLDPGVGVKYLTMEAKYDPAHATGSSPVVLVAADNMFFPKGTILVNDNGGDASSFQNFTNLAFFNSLIDHDPNMPGVQGGAIAPAGNYVIETIIIDPNHKVVSDITSHLILT